MRDIDLRVLQLVWYEYEPDIALVDFLGMTERQYQAWQNRDPLWWEA